MVQLRGGTRAQEAIDVSLPSVSAHEVRLYNKYTGLSKFLIPLLLGIDVYRSQCALSLRVQQFGEAPGSQLDERVRIS